MPLKFFAAPRRSPRLTEALPRAEGSSSSFLRPPPATEDTVDFAATNDIKAAKKPKLSEPLNKKNSEPPLKSKKSVKALTNALMQGVSNSVKDARPVFLAGPRKEPHPHVPPTEASSSCLASQVVAVTGFQPNTSKALPALPPLWPREAQDDPTLSLSPTEKSYSLSALGSPTEIGTPSLCLSSPSPFNLSVSPSGNSSNQQEPTVINGTNCVVPAPAKRKFVSDWTTAVQGETETTADTPDNRRAKSSHELAQSSAHSAIPPRHPLRPLPTKKTPFAHTSHANVTAAEDTVAVFAPTIDVPMVEEDAVEAAHSLLALHGQEPPLVNRGSRGENVSGLQLLGWVAEGATSYAKFIPGIALQGGRPWAAASEIAAHRRATDPAFALRERGYAVADFHRNRPQRTVSPYPPLQLMPMSHARGSPSSSMDCDATPAREARMSDRGAGAPEGTPCYRSRVRLARGFGLNYRAPQETDPAYLYSLHIIEQENAKNKRKRK